MTPVAKIVWLSLAAVLAGCNGTTGTLVTLADAGEPALPGAAGSSGIPVNLAGSWQIQLTGTLDTSLAVDLYEADLFALDAPSVRAIHDAGRKLTCYVSVGTAEPWRSDYNSFPASAIGNSVTDYPQERWLDVRDEGVRQVIAQRLDLATSTNCDAVELSNLQAHLADSGFPLTQTDVLGYATWLIEQSHARKLSAGISASDDLVPLLVTDADWGLTEECLAYDSCSAWQAFTRVGKPVFMIEYGSTNDAPALCPEAARLGFSLVIKRRALDAFRVGCPASTAKP